MFSIAYLISCTKPSPIDSPEPDAEPGLIDGVAAGACEGNAGDFYTVDLDHPVDEVCISLNGGEQMCRATSEELGGGGCARFWDECWPDPSLRVEARTDGYLLDCVLAGSVAEGETAVSEESGCRRIELQDHLVVCPLYEGPFNELGIRCDAGSAIYQIGLNGDPGPGGTVVHLSSSFDTFDAPIDVGFEYAHACVERPRCPPDDVTWTLTTEGGSCAMAGDGADGEVPCEVVPLELGASVSDECVHTGR